MLNDSKKIAYYRNKSKVYKIIKSNLRNTNDVVYGGQALNSQLPQFLQRPTKDYDVFSKNPKKDAKKLESSLDKRFGGNFFSVEPAQHKGTYKIRSNIDNEAVADFTERKRNPPHIKRNGINYVTLSWQEVQLRKILKDKESKYRHQKDKETLQRIKLLRRLKKR